MTTKGDSADRVSLNQDSEENSENNVTMAVPKMSEENVVEGGEGDEKIELTIEDAPGETGFDFSNGKKWWIMIVVFLVQTSMNLNTSLYSNGQGGISKKFGVSVEVARVGAAIFLITYAFGCELWAPWSEEFGRWPIMQLSLLLVNIFNFPVIYAPNYATIGIARTLGGFASAGGSVTLAMVADVFDSDSQQYPISFVALSSVGGSVIGAIIGGFLEQYLAWQWCTWFELFFGIFVQLLHLFTVPETRTTIMLDNAAVKRREQGEEVYGPDELHPFLERFSWSEVLHIWARPFRMFVTEPIVLCLSLLSGFSDGLILMLVQALPIVYPQWNFNDWQMGVAFVPIGLGYLLGSVSFIPAISRTVRLREENPESENAQYESRLWWLLFTAPCLPVGLLIFAFTCNGPPMPWIASMVGLVLVGIANYCIYMATIDYMICAYGPFSASATGGNGWARDFLAGVLTMPAQAFYDNIPGPNNKPHMWATLILFFISFVLVAAVFVIYFYGPELRKRSAFAQNLDDEEADAEEEQLALEASLGDLPGSRASGASMGGDMGRASASGRASGAGTRASARGQLLPNMGQGSYMSSYDMSHLASHRGSPVGSRSGSPVTRGSAAGGSLDESLNRASDRASGAGSRASYSRRGRSYSSSSRASATHRPWAYGRDHVRRDHLHLGAPGSPGPRPSQEDMPNALTAEFIAQEGGGN